MRVIASVLLLLAGTLAADTVRLKNKASIEGFFQQEQAGFVTFVKLNVERITVNSDLVETIEFSLSGISMCYTQREGSKTCDVLLASVSGNDFVLAEGKAKRSVRKIAIEDISSYEIKKVVSYQRVLPYLPEGKRTVLTLIGEEKIEGTVIGVEEKGVRICDPSGQTQTIPEAQIAAATVNLINNPFHWLDPRNLIIGYPQIQSGRGFVGGTMMLGFGLLGAGVAGEYAAAMTANRKAHSDLGVLLFNRTDSFQSFRRHQENQRYLGTGAFLLYAFHWFDLYLHQDDSATAAFQVTGVEHSPSVVRSKDTAGFSLLFALRF